MLCFYLVSIYNYFCIFYKDYYYNYEKFLKFFKVLIKLVIMMFLEIVYKGIILEKGVFFFLKYDL